MDYQPKINNLNNGFGQTKTKNYEFDYYYFTRTLNVHASKKIVEGYIYVQLRLDSKFMNDPNVRMMTGFVSIDQIPDTDLGVDIDIEASYHCAATKGLIGHVGFTLIPKDPQAIPDVAWGPLYNTRLTYVKTQTFSQIKAKIQAFPFISPTTQIEYRAIPKSIRSIRRKRER